MASPDPLHSKTDPLYQKAMHLTTHSAPITHIAPLSSLSPDQQALFKPPQEEKEPYILTTPSTIFHAQGGGQPSDTGTISNGNHTFAVHQVRKVESAILHMGCFSSTDHSISTKEKAAAEEASRTTNLIGKEGTQQIDASKRLLHSRFHTAGHILGLAASLLKNRGEMDKDIVDGKASHYPGAAFVEFTSLIPSTLKPSLQSAVDELVDADLAVKIHYWDEERARRECTGGMEGVRGDREEGVRVVEIGDVGGYPCGGTHVESTKGCGRVVLRNVKRQKGVTKVSYEVVDV